MEALVLSCGTGGGHNSACMAIQQELTAKGHKIRTLNPYLLKSKRTADVINHTYNLVAQKVPSAFGMVYHLGDAYRRLPVSSPVYHLNSRMAPLLERYLVQFRFDAVVMTHLFPAEIITCLKRHGKPVPKTYFIATDYTCTPFTEETDCDYYIIPSQKLTDEFVSRGIPEDRIVPLGIPVRRQFREEMSREEARRRLGLDMDKTYILIAGGSIGAGQIEQIVPLLLEHYGDSVRLIVVCGNNHALYQHLDRSGYERCILLSYTSQMAEYMRACDLFLSKPGGLSSTEAAVAGTALIHITPIPGCETSNLHFFEQNGMCFSVLSPGQQLTDACDRLLDRDRQQAMLRQQRAVIPANAADAICEFILDTSN